MHCKHNLTFLYPPSETVNMEHGGKIEFDEVMTAAQAIVLEMNAMIKEFILQLPTGSTFSVSDIISRAPRYSLTAYISINRYPSPALPSVLTFIYTYLIKLEPLGASAPIFSSASLRLDAIKYYQSCMSQPLMSVPIPNIGPDPSC